ncbi:MAG: hypothetical protein ABR587_05005 [Candidatus Binatia bacterium]
MDWLFAYTDPSIDWNYAMVTLVVRFIGVFVVMALVQVALQAASHVIHRIEARPEAKAASRGPEPAVSSLTLSAVAGHEDEFDGAAIAAIGLALSEEAAERSAASRRTLAAPPSSGGTSAWGMSGRLRGLR